MTIGRLGGVRIRLHPFFLALLILSVLGGQGKAVLLLMCLLVSHELAHLLVARAYDLHVSEIEFLPFGGVARIEELAESEAGVEAAVAVAGPLNNALLLAVGLALDAVGWLDQASARLFLEGNLALLTFNLLPVLPLDGGRFCHAVLAYRLGNARATRILARGGQACAVLMVGAGVLALYCGLFVPNALLLGGFVFMGATRELAAGGWQGIQVLWRKRERLRRRGILPVRELVAMRDTPLREVIRHLMPQRYHLIWVADEGMHVLGLVEEPTLLEGLSKLGAGALLGDLLARE